MDSAEMKKRGIDWDLAGCLENNPQENIKLEDIDKVLAVVEGENELTSWHWIIKLKGARKYVYMTGWCDYTGWDCISDAKAYPTRTTRLKALKDVLSEMTSVDTDVYKSLHQQLVGEKSETWKEKMDKEFGV